MAGQIDDAVAAALQGIGDLAGVRGMHAFQYLDFTGGLVHCEAEALHIERDWAW